MKLYEVPKEPVSVYVSEERVLPLPIYVQILKSSLHDRSCVLVSPEDFELQYAQNVFFRANMRNSGWILTSQVGIERMQYRELDHNGIVACGISVNSFMNLSPEKRSVRLPGENAVLAGNSCLDGSYDCLVLRADIYKPRPVRYAYTFSMERSSRAEALVSSLRKR